MRTGSCLPPRVVGGREVVHVGRQRSLGIDDYVGLVGIMHDDVGPHPAAVITRQRAPVRAAQRLLSVKLAPLDKPAVLQHRLEDMLPPVTLYPRVARQCVGQLAGIVAYLP